MRGPEGKSASRAPGSRDLFEFVRHPPERGLQHALYGGSCCTTCCCCCCCCAHSVGGVIGAVVAQEIAIRKLGVYNRRATSPARLYWMSILLLTAGLAVIGQVVFGLLAAVVAMPFIQLVASGVTYFRIRSEVQESQRGTARRILGWTTLGALLGAIIGGFITWQMILAK